MNRLFSIWTLQQTSLSLLFLFLSVLFTHPVVAQTTRYVSTTGTNANPVSATSWAASTTNLQGAINASNTNDQVWVAQGTYKPTTGDDRNASFSMKNGVTIYGGFAGTETALSQRPALSVTVPSGSTLSGDVGIPGNPTDNSFHIVNNPNGITPSAVLNGFVIVEGNTSGIFPDYYGAGVYNNGSGVGNSCSPRIVNCFFVNNSATEGGALYNNANNGGISNAQVVNCVFLNNTATSFGGAVENDGGDGGSNNSEFMNCVFQGNSVPGNSGGAVYNFGAVGSSNPRFVNCSFLNNSAASGGALYNDGSNGGICNPQLTNCSFQGNAASSGGVLYNYITTSGQSQPQLRNCVLFNNGGAATLGNSSTNTVQASYSLFEPSVTGYTSLTGNLTSSLSPFASTTNVQLANGTPPINAGDPATTSATVGITDLVGNFRFFQNGRIDMGATEYQNRLEIYTLADGNWNNPAVWSVARLPQLGERVRLKHLIQIPASFSAQSGPLIYNLAAKLIYGAGGRLSVAPE